MSKKKSLKREVIEWGIFIGIIITLYVTGLHTPVLGALQGLVLKTGLVQPSTEKNDYGLANYSFELKDVNDESVPFETFKGKTIFFNIWATWCPPCIAEMPDIDNLYNDFSDNSEIVFVMLSVDKEFETAKTFVKKKEYNLPIYQLNSNLPEIFNSSSIPTTFVIDPDGKIVVNKKGMAKYHTNKFKKFLLGLSKGV